MVSSCPRHPVSKTKTPTHTHTLSYAHTMSICTHMHMYTPAHTYVHTHNELAAFGNFNTNVLFCASELKICTGMPLWEYTEWENRERNNGGFKTIL